MDAWSLGSVAEVHFVLIVHLDKRVEYLKEMYTTGQGIEMLELGILHLYK